MTRPAVPSISVEEWNKSRGKAKSARKARAVRLPIPTTARWNDDVLTIIMPIPHPALSKNARVHWRVKAEKTTEMRKAVAAAISRLGLAPMWDRATMQAKFYWPDRRTRDDSNANHTLEPARDALQPHRSIPNRKGLTVAHWGAGVVLNDSGVVQLPAIMEVDRANPRVEITVRRIIE